MGLFMTALEQQVRKLTQQLTDYAYPHLGRLVVGDIERAHIVAMLKPIWEEKNETVDFPLVALEEGRAYFDGLTYHHLGPNKMDIYLAMHTKDGVREVIFKYSRVSSD